MTSKDDIKGLVSLKFLRPWPKARNVYALGLSNGTPLESTYIILAPLNKCSWYNVSIIYFDSSINFFFPLFYKCRCIYNLMSYLTDKPWTTFSAIYPEPLWISSTWQVSLVLQCSFFISFALPHVKKSLVLQFLLGPPNDGGCVCLVLLSHLPMAVFKFWPA